MNVDNAAVGVFFRPASWSVEFKNCDVCVSVCLFVHLSTFSRRPPPVFCICMKRRLLVEASGHIIPKLKEENKYLCKKYLHTWRA